MTVEQVWARVMAWLQSNAPATAAGIRPPAEPTARQAAEAMFPVAWPEDLRAWYALQDGESMEQLWRCTLPHHEILSIEQVMEDSQMRSGFLTEDEREAEPEAGGYAFGFLPEFVAIGSDGCGDALFVDLRPGALHGCVTSFPHEEGVTEGPTWASVAHMLDQLASSLEAGTVCDGWLPSVEDGYLTWDLVDADKDVVPADFNQP